MAATFTYDMLGDLTWEGQVPLLLSGDSYEVLLLALAVICDTGLWEVDDADLDALEARLGKAQEEFMLERGLPMDSVLMYDEKAAGVDGGASIVGLQRRTLNKLRTTVETQSWVSLAADKFTLAAGTYMIMATAPAYQVQKHYLVLFNESDGVIVANGSMERSAVADATGTTATMMCILEVKVATTYALKHYTNGVISPHGLGLKNEQVASIFASVRIDRRDS